MYFCVVKFIVFITIVFFGIQVHSQWELPAHFAKDKIQLDGKLDEKDWALAKPSDVEFTTIRPIPALKSKRKTEVKFLFNNEAIYIAAVCYDQKDSISKVFTVRDDYSPNADLFSIYLDTYNDHQNGFYFGVTSQGVQLDAKIFNGDFSDQLNLVWNSKVVKTDEAWVVEICIPYSAIRFPKKDVQQWNVNFSRQIARYREESTWFPVNPDFENYLVHSGKVVGVKEIYPPLRLGLIPYVSTYLNKNKNMPMSKSLFGGMDIKYGINESFTLDVTLVPDFGQVIYDNQVLNTSPFEIQFNENRQFFTEGMELFNKSGIFYSRRIGIQAPWEVLQTNLKENEIIASIPGTAQLYNATKFSGRTKKGLGIGVFNALSAPNVATAYNTTNDSSRTFTASPLTNFNAVVFDQNLRNNSSVTLTNTNVIRQGAFYDANVTSFNSNLNSKGNKFFLNTKATLSQKLYPQLNEMGFNYGIGAGKQRGNFVFNGNVFVENDTYDPNDLGFNPMNNRKVATAYVAYRYYKPFWKITKCNTNVSLSYNRLYNPDVYTSASVEWSAFAMTKKYHAFGLNAYSAFTKSYDYFEPRTWGYFYLVPRWSGFGGWISTNYQKKLALDINASFTTYENYSDWKVYNLALSPRIRVSKKCLLIYNWNIESTRNDIGYAYQFGTPVDTIQGILFGKRNRNNLTQLIELNYTLTNRMNISLRTRHYWSVLKYEDFYTLNQNGTLEANPTLGLDGQGISAFNLNYNAITVDLAYRWVFLPGSELSLVWKSAVFSSVKEVTSNYFQNLDNTLNLGLNNGLSIKVLYWLDAQSIKKIKRKS